MGALEISKTPFYKIQEASAGVFTIYVDWANTPPTVDRITEEALKSPLNAVAFVQEVAKTGNPIFLGLKKIYQSYHHYFDDHDPTVILRVCKEIISEANSDAFLKECATYLIAVLNDQSIDPSCAKAQLFLNQFIPGIEKTISSHPIKQLYKAQEVTIPEIRSPHLAFPDLIRYKGEVYCAFREGKSHVGYQDEGKIRVLKGYFNKEIKKWNFQNYALLSKPGIDLRDPRFFINGDGQLQMVMGGSIINEKDQTIKMIPHLTVLKENAWQIKEAAIPDCLGGILGQWIWRVTWNVWDNCGYAFSYGKDQGIILVKTKDGVTFEKVCECLLKPLEDLSEATIRFKRNGEAVVLMRSKEKGLIGTSIPDRNVPYTKWSWHHLLNRLGGPNFVIEENGTMHAVSRFFFLKENNDLDEATIYGKMDADSFTPLFRFNAASKSSDQTSGDNSYPGIICEEDGTMTIAFYSGNNHKESRIFMTTIQL